ncbi:hypothetical protein AX16_009027 [Volvariella volvacea WC 439]|nr:hypothetical protein AX16_009027 [Volvariella volvacea WC 439]
MPVATEEMLDRLMDINIKGTFFCYKYAAEQMIKQGRGGRIIGASSEAGKRGSMRMGAYSATKFAIRGLTQSAALDLGRHGITVNAYAPGGIDTQMLKNLSDGYAKTESAQSSDFYKWLADKTPVGYSGTPAEIASLVSYLVSKEAHFITGQSPFIPLYPSRILTHSLTFVLELLP